MYMYECIWLPSFVIVVYLKGFSLFYILIPFAFQLFPAIDSLGRCIHATTAHITLSYFFLSPIQYLATFMSQSFCYSIHCQQPYISLPK